MCALHGMYRFADRTVSIDSVYDMVHAMCRDYAVDADRPDVVVRTTPVDIAFEESVSTDGIEYTDDYLETLAVYRKVAEAMPSFDTLLVHGSCVAVDGAGYLFCAPSGTGKSTHVRLLRELLGSRAHMVNDDKPLVGVSDTGAIVYGTPWDGKHHLSNNVSVRLRSICLIERALENRIRRAKAAEAYPRVLQQVYRPMNQGALARTLSLVDTLLALTDVWVLGCNMDRKAAELSFAAMSGRGAP